MTDFDSYLQEFRKRSLGTDLDFWADVAYLTQSHPPPAVEKRFSFGFAGWWVWALQKCLGKGTVDTTSTSGAPEPTATGFRLLPTPAHLDSLSPLVTALAPSITFGHPLEDSLPRRHHPLGLPASLPALPRRLKWDALIAALRKAQAIENLLRHPSPLGPPLPPAFLSRMAEYIFTAELELRRWRRTPPPLHSLIVSYELIADTKGLITWAREAGIPVIHVMHGLRLPTYQITRATDLVLFSSIDQRWFRERIPDSVAIHCSGHPRLENLHRNIPPPPPPHNRLPRITFFSQPSEMNYGREERLRDWSILSGLRGKAEVRFRLHPRELEQVALDDLKQLGADFVEISHAGLANDLAWSDAVASSWSTVSLEAAACGRGVFWTCSSPDRYEAPAEMRNHGIGALLRAPNDWAHYLDHWNQHHVWPAEAAVSESQLVALGMVSEDPCHWQNILPSQPPHELKTEGSASTSQRTSGNAPART